MKFVSLISSGIDSPVATYLLSKKIEEIILVHGDNIPFTEKAENDKFIKIANHLKDRITSKIKIYIIPHGSTISSYKLDCENRFTCIFCKRMLVRYAEKIALKEKAVAIVMGDSLGQVASQTLKNIRVVEEATSMPILRPLIGLDKEDIIKIAKKIGTYELSIIPSAGCSAVPKKPSTQARLDQIQNQEKRLNIKKMLNEAVKNARLIKL